jgi:DNA (cytosine-5)-methyltransferase 1
MKEHKFNYNWTLKDAVFTKDKGKVFSCFACGGGSTMGYKLAGFDVLGCNEIDPKMIEAYKTNHNPKYAYLEPIQTFKNRTDLPKELYELDILDGSPPCSSFSMAGNRDKDWGKEKKFREGQAEQVLDTLFFDFIDLAKELQPKVVVAENVKGLLLGNAKEYVRKIYTAFDEAGYYCQHFLLDASKMGVPQRRERVFFICLRKDLAKPFLHWQDMFTEIPKIEMEFNEKEIPFKEIYEKNGKGEQSIPPSYSNMWDQKIITEYSMNETTMRIEGVDKFFSVKYIHLHKVLNTITGGEKNILYDEKRTLCKSELCNGGSYPNDYNFLDVKPGYLIGMSVPPVMTAQVASNIYDQWLNKLENNLKK